jgi:hypothetical protein
MLAANHRPAACGPPGEGKLAGRIARALTHDGTVQPQPGLHFRRHSQPTEPVHAFGEPAFCVIAQDGKEIHLGAGYRVGYDAAAHINREYQRHFGQPPMRDVERLRARASPSAILLAWECTR